MQNYMYIESQPIFAIRYDLFDNDKKLSTKHNGKPAEKARNFVPSYPQVKLDKYFDNDSVLIFENPANVYEMDNWELLGMFHADLEDYYDFTTENLKEGHEGYFNCHRWPHIYRTTTSAVDLAAQLGLDEYTQKLVTIAGSLHDTGNAAARAEHDKLGASISAAMYPAILSRHEEAHIIQDAIYRHNEGPYRSMIGYNGAPAETRQETLQKKYASVVAPLLFMADKADIDPSRVEQNALNPTIIEAHKHSASNLYTKSKGFTVDENGITWTLGFDPRVPKVEGRDYSELTRQTPNGEMLKGPSYMRVNPEDENSDIDPKKVWKEIWDHKMYGPKEPTDASRLTGMIDAGLTLSHQVNINYVNEITGEVIDYRSFTVANMDQQIAELIEEHKNI